VGQFDVSIDAATLDAIISEGVSDDAPGVAVGIAVAGHTLYRRAFGKAHCHYSHNLSPSTPMRIGSITKQFTALTYLLLCESGMAALDDPLARWLPEVGANTKNIFMRDLLDHSSGLRDAYDIACLSCGAETELTADNLLSFYLGFEDTNFSPRHGWAYNNGAYLLLSLAIERIAGQPLNAIFEKLIFEPLNMTGSSLQDRDRACAPARAGSHIARGDGGYDVAITGTLCAGAGAMTSTIDDMLRWLAHMSAPQIGTSETWQVLHQPSRLATGIEAGYGLGFVVQDYRGTKTISHSGGVNGGNAQMLKLPEAKLDIIVIANRNDIDSVALANSIVDASVVGLLPVSDAEGGAIFEGIYQSASSGRVLELRSAGGRKILALDGNEQPLVLGADNIFRPPSHRAYVKIALTVESSGTALHLNEFGAHDRFALVPPGSSQGQELNGRYRCEALNLELVIKRNTLRLISEFGLSCFELHPLARDVWRADAKGPIPMRTMICAGTGGITLATARNRPLQFQPMAKAA
jgi:CubicO group peptidase (beta-lactamase class C family)